MKMTIQQAIQVLKRAASEADGDLAVALDMAIKMLEHKAEYDEFLAEVRN